MKKTICLLLSLMLAASALSCAASTENADPDEAEGVQNPAASVETELLRFFDDPERRAAYGDRARAAVARRCGVVGRCADELLEALG